MTRCLMARPCRRAGEGLVWFNWAALCTQPPDQRLGHLQGYRRHEPSSRGRWCLSVEELRLGAATWHLLSEVEGDGAMHEVVDPGPLHDARFYRVPKYCPN